MSVKISEVAEKLGLSQKDLKGKIIELGFDIKKTARTLDKEVAELVLDELSTEDVSVSETGDTVEAYEDIIDRQLDREIIRSQRKRTAGRDSKKKKKEDEEEENNENETGKLEIGDIISVKEFAEKSGVSAAKVIGELMKNGVLANINQQIDFDTIQIIADELGVEVRHKRSEASAEDILDRNIGALLEEEDSKVLSKRPPVVSIMGHVDHGKTSLLDHIREANVVDSESGGITQHVAAYQVKRNGEFITFLDTPGHEAFTAMRARGAKATDIAILVVAANEGVKPQTIEAINHAKDAEIPIIVAITKVDLPDSNVDKVKGELVEHGLQPEDWGGKTIMTPVSAMTGEGIDTLLEMILLVAEMEDLKANAKREAVATVIEAHMDKSLGPVATMIVNTGTLKIMDNFVIGSTYGRIKAMFDHNGKRIKSALPSVPVLIAGLDQTPVSGDLLQVVSDEKAARVQAANVRALKETKGEDIDGSDISQLFSKFQSGNLKALKIILKTDNKGSLEAIKSSLSKIKSDDVLLKIVHADVANVNDSDVMMAAAGGALIFAFHVTAVSQVNKLAQQYGVDIRKYTVIYKLIDDVKNIMTGLLDPESIETVTGKARVKQVFFVKRSEKIVGCGVENGVIENKSLVRVLRNDEEIGEGRIDSLKKVDKVVKEIKEGNDCGIKFVGNVDLEEGDVFECYKVETRARTLEG